MRRRCLYGQLINIGGLEVSTGNRHFALATQAACLQEEELSELPPPSGATRSSWLRLWLGAARASLGELDLRM